jgi:hypothetical protein
MASKALPSQEVLRQLLDYDPETGKLFWLPRGESTGTSESEARRWNPRYAGKEAGFIDPWKYVRIRVGHEAFLAHRIIWVLFYGEEPSGMIDHANGARSDNRICNLRVASAVQNCMNASRYKNNTSGLKGVCKVKSSGKWRATIQANKAKTYLGDFKTKEEAHAAYRAAAVKLHGDFARLT